MRTFPLLLVACAGVTSVEPDASTAVFADFRDPDELVALEPDDVTAGLEILTPRGFRMELDQWLLESGVVGEFRDDVVGLSATRALAMAPLESACADCRGGLDELWACREVAECDEREGGSSTPRREDPDAPPGRRDRPPQRVPGPPRNP